MVLFFVLVIAVCFPDPKIGGCRPLESIQQSEKDINAYESQPIKHRLSMHDCIDVDAVLESSCATLHKAHQGDNNKGNYLSLLHVYTCSVCKLIIYTKVKANKWSDML